MRGEGIFDKISSAVQHSYNSNKHHFHRIGKNIAHQAVHHAHQQLKEPVEEMFGSHGKKHLGALAKWGHNVIGKGEGIHKRRGRPRKHHASHGEGWKEDLGRVALDAGSNYLKNRYLGGGEGVRRRGRKGHGEGEGVHYKHGGSLSGGALFPAGYGEGRAGRRGRRGKGAIGQQIGSTLGGLAGNFLPF